MMQYAISLLESGQLMERPHDQIRLLTYACYMLAISSTSLGIASASQAELITEKSIEN
jgi:hypothetical protein